MSLLTSLGSCGPRQLLLSNCGALYATMAVKLVGGALSYISLTQALYQAYHAIHCWGVEGVGTSQDKEETKGSARACDLSFVLIGTA